MKKKNWMIFIEKEIHYVKCVPSNIKRTGERKKIKLQVQMIPVMRIIDKLIAERSSISSEVVFQKLEEVLDSNETILRKLKEINLSETEKSPEKFKSSKK